jgi:hypothetical protein
MPKSSKRQTKSAPRSIDPGCMGDPAKDDPRDAVDLEFLTIALSLARVREIIHSRADSIPLRGSAGYRKSPLKKSRRKDPTRAIQKPGVTLRTGRGQTFRAHAPAMTT